MWRCRAYCLAPAFTTKETHIMHSDFDVAMLGVRKYERKRLCYVGSADMRVCICGVREIEREREREMKRESERHRERGRKTEADRE